MSSRRRYLAFYTAETRKPILLKLYRQLLKKCLCFKTIDLPSGLWLSTEVRLGFIRNRDFKMIDDITRAYEKGLKYESELTTSIGGNLESQRRLIRECYGQEGSRKIEFVASYCLERKINFEQMMETYTYNVPIPKEYSDYMKANKKRQAIYEGLFEPKFNFEKLLQQNKDEEQIISSFKKHFLRRHQLEQSTKSHEEYRQKCKEKEKTGNKSKTS